MSLLLSNQLLSTLLQVNYQAVQETFIQFFMKEHHHMIKSSSILPWNDESLFFVNAGMNQFKPVLLGRAAPVCPRAVNSQKCIRVGGKHNDLDMVGTDSYHHTFFEMLGSWSFGDYFKSEACSLAWCLLTEVYKLPPQQLYVTYFGGDATLGIPPDTETCAVWKQIGVPSSRILPYGLSDNFWEVGPVGPCGPCTEIHYYRGEATSSEAAAALVNAGHEDVIELWNIVFVQYERLADGSLSRLPHHHVDTGMGLERLTATLNGHSSNYDTDLFQPLFESIRTWSGRSSYGGSWVGASAALDTGYRVLADHARAAVVAVADGALPNTSSNLRKLLHRMFLSADEQFGFISPVKAKATWLTSLCEAVADTLCCRYPEVRSELHTVDTVLQAELHQYTQAGRRVNTAWSRLVSREPAVSVLQNYCSESLIHGLSSTLEDLRAAADEELPVHVAVRLNVEHGFSLDLIEDVAKAFRCSVNRSGYESERRRVKRHKTLRHTLPGGGLSGSSLNDVASQLRERDVPTTCRDSLYQYCLRRERLGTDHVENDHCIYEYKPVHTEVVAIISDGKLVNELTAHTSLGIVLRESNFYAAGGGQVSDVGTITFLPRLSESLVATPNEGDSITFAVKEVEEVDSYVIHWGVVNKSDRSGASAEVAVTHAGCNVRCSVDPQHRLACSQHHTATHMLLAALRMLAGITTRQLSSHVDSDGLRIDVGTYGSLTSDDILLAERDVQSWVASGGAVTRQQLSLSSALSLPHISLLPGAVYPDTVTIVTAHRADGCPPAVEPCCGTHLHDVADVQDFVITAVDRSRGAGVRTIQAVCGSAATAVLRRGALRLEEMERRLQDTLTHSVSVDTNADCRRWANESLQEVLPYRVSRDLVNFEKNLTKVQTVGKLNRDAEDTEAMLSRLRRAHSEQPRGALVLSLCSEFGASQKVLKGAYNILAGRSHLVLLRVGNSVRARAVVEQGALTAGASASAWLAPVAHRIPGHLKGGTNAHVLSTFSANGDLSEESVEELLQECRAYIARYDEKIGDVEEKGEKL